MPTLYDYRNCFVGIFKISYRYINFNLDQHKRISVEGTKATQFSRVTYEQSWSKISPIVCNAIHLHGQIMWHICGCCFSVQFSDAIWYIGLPSNIIFILAHRASLLKIAKASAKYDIQLIIQAVKTFSRLLREFVW